MQTIKIHTNPLLKILICFCLVFTFLFVQPKEKLPEAEAVLPAVLLSVLGSIVLDLAVDMGIDFIDKKAAKEWSENIVGKLWNKFGSVISDLKPTKTNTGKWTLKLGKGLLTAITAEIANDAITKKENSKERETEKEPFKEIDTTTNTYVGKKSYEVDVTGTTDPFYNTSIAVSVAPNSDSISSQSAYAFFLKYGKIILTPQAYEQKTLVQLCIGDTCTSQSVEGGYYVVYSPISYSDSGIRMRYNRSFSPIPSTSFGTADMYPYIGSSYYPLFEQYKKMLSEQNKVIYEFEGVIVTDGFEAYLSIPDVSPEVLEQLDPSKLPPALQNDKEFEFEISDPTIIDAEYEVINEGDQFEWDVVEQDIVNQGDSIYYDIDNIYSPTINNYYTVTPEQKEEIENDITIIVDNDNTNNPPATGEGSTDGFMYCVDKPGAMVVSCKDIEAVDGSILTYIKNSYDYAVNAVKTGADGLKTIVEGSTGLIALYSNIFDWLPDEVTILLTSGLLLMIGLRVFRK